MPIYEYVCRQCGQQLEWLTRDGQTPSCPSCNSRDLERKLSVPAAHTSGSGGQECPVRESGSCGMPRCCGNDCGMGDLL